MKTLVLTEDDVYMSENGRQFCGGVHKLYGAELAVLVKRDGSFEVLKNRFDLGHDEIIRELEDTKNTNCNMDKQKITFKIKHANGVHPLNDSNVYEYIGKSRIDGFPMYSFVYQGDGYPFCFSKICRNFIFNGRPGYTPTPEDFEMVSSLEDWSANSSLMEIRPLGQPSGLLYCMDYKCGGDEFDERLLLMI